MMKIALLGDVGLYGRFSLKSGLNPNHYFSDFIKKTKDCDYIVANLETPFTEKFKEYSAKSAYIGSFKKNIEIIKCLNISYVNLANNHTGDYGAEGYKLTKSVLSDNGIKYFGIEGIQEYLEYESNSICFSGFCNMDSNPVYLSNPEKINGVGVNIVDVDNILASLHKANDAGYLNILAFHSGLEHVNLPGRADVCFARYLAKQYDFVLYGHHPHVVQAYEKVNNSYLFYSLGNFCFDDVYSKVSRNPLVKMTEANKIGLVPILNIKNSTVVDVEYIWTYLGEDKMEIINSDPDRIIENVKSIDLSDLDEIENERNILLENWLAERKSKRDLNWYLSRLRCRYVKLYLNSKKNSNLYNKHYIKKLLDRSII